MRVRALKIHVNVHVLSALWEFMGEKKHFHESTKSQSTLPNS